MLYLIGLGLADEKDITVKGLEIVRRASRVYLEAYTAILLVEKDVLVRFSVISRSGLLSDSTFLCRANADVRPKPVGSVLWPAHHPCRP